MDGKTLVLSERSARWRPFFFTEHCAICRCLKLFWGANRLAFWQRPFQITASTGPISRISQFKAQRRVRLLRACADLPDEAAGRGGLESEAEDFKSHVLSCQAALGLLSSGEADTGPLVLTLMWLREHRHALRRDA